MTKLSKKLRSLREQAGLTKAALAEKLDITASAVANWEADRKTPPMERLQQLAAIYKLSPAEAHELARVAAHERFKRRMPEERKEILSKPTNHDTPQPEHRDALPLYGEIPAGAPVAAVDAEETYWVLAHQAEPDSYVLRVQGDSMSGTIEDEDLVLMKWVPNGEVEEYHNRICAVLLDGESTLKRVQVQKSGKHTIVTLKADRADFPTVTFVLGTRDFHIQGVAMKIVERDL